MKLPPPPPREPPPWREPPLPDGLLRPAELLLPDEPPLPKIPPDPVQCQSGHLVVSQAGRRHHGRFLLQGPGQARAIHGRLKVRQGVDRHRRTPQPRAHQHRLMGPAHVAPSHDLDLGNGEQGLATVR